MNHFRIVFSLIVLSFLVLVWLLAPLPEQQSSSSALLQLNATDEEYRQSQTTAQFPVREVVLVVCLGALFLAWLPKHRNMLLLVVALPALAACGAKREVITIEPNESAVVIDLTSPQNQEQAASEAFYREHMVNTQQITVDFRWIQTGGIGTGDWYPNTRVIRVSRTPESREWKLLPSETQDLRQMALCGETIESQGWCVGVLATAHIEAEDVPTFLYHYATRPLNDVMDAEIRDWYQVYLANEFGDDTIDELRRGKSEVFLAALEASRLEFEERGITIDNFGLVDGFEFLNVEIQQVIDQAFIREEAQRAARANATTSAIEAGAAANATRIAVQGEATQEAIEAQSAIDQAGAYAAATATLAAANVQALQEVGNALTSNPAIVPYTYAQQWDGRGCQSFCGSDQQVVPFVQVTQQAP